MLLLLLLVLFFLAGCGRGEDSSIRFIRWTPHGIVFVRSGKLFRWTGDAHTLPSRIGKWLVKEERFALSPDGGKIAIVPGGNKVWDIWEVDIVNGEGRRITDSVFKDYFPVYGPSGQYIYFISYRGKRPDIWRVRPDDPAAEKMTDDVREEEQLAVSPDGKTLLYTAFADDVGLSLYVLEIGSGEIRRVAEGLAYVSCLKFSPPGDRYAFCAAGGLWLGEKGGRPSRLSDAEFAAWDAGKRALYYCAGGDIRRRTFGIFSRDRRLTRNVGIDSCPSPSPDGRRVAYSTGPGEKPELLTVVDSSFSPVNRVWCPTDVELINDFYRVNGKPVEAARYLTSVIEGIGEREKIARIIAADYLKARKGRKAIAVLREYTRDNYEIGKIYMYYLRDFPSAMECFKRSRAAKKELMLLYSFRPGLLKSYCRGWVEMERGNYGKGLRIIDGFLRRAGKVKALEAIYYERAEAYDRELHDADKAIPAYGEALEAWPDSDRAVPARIRLAELYEGAGALDEAMGVYRSVAKDAGGEDSSVKAAACVSILRITLEQGGDIQPLLGYIDREGGAYRKEFTNGAVELLDGKGKHDEANRIIRLAVAEWGLGLKDITDGLGRSLLYVDTGALVRVDIGKLPPWFKERANIIASKVSPVSVKAVGELMKSPSASKARKIMGDMDGLPGSPELDDYILGNLYLNEGDVSRAVSCFMRLCRDEDNSYYHHQLSCCLRADPGAAEEWLKLERKYTFAFWDDVLEAIDIVSGRRDLFSDDRDVPRDPNFVVAYESFIAAHPDSLLVPACAARIASALPEREKRKALLDIIAGHKGGCISIPFALLMSNFAGSGNYGLALDVGEPLARSSDDPSIKLAVAELLSEVGQERKAMAFFWDISMNCTESPEWSAAQEALISDLSSSGKNKSALLMVDELIERRPSSEFVESGEAQLLRIELLVELGRLREAAGAAVELTARGGPGLNELPGRITDELARFMFDNKKESFMELYSTAGPEYKVRLEEMVPELRNKEQDTSNKIQTMTNNQSPNKIK
ncbi:MAG: tetratricopeptide repeat protein [Candidatus Tritonobacter lacicola]|nr:tetratricopeptide repeat protein [Candidatus Tritonobacter lacicola]